MLNVVFEECTKRNMMYNFECLEHGVVCIGHAFDIGDIHMDDLIAGRKNEFMNLESIRYDDKQVEEILQRQKQDMEYLLRTIKAGGEIRIWRSNAPYNICAFLFLCDTICDYDINAYCVDLPSDHSSWALVEAKMYSESMQKQYLLNKDEIIVCRNIWKTLQEENAPLRTLVDGKITSVSEDFYDELIKQNILGECLIEQVLGNIARTNIVLVSRGWLVLRIKAMIATGIIKVVYMCKPNLFKTIIKLSA